MCLVVTLAALLTWLPWIFLRRNAASAPWHDGSATRHDGPPTRNDGPTRYAMLEPAVYDCCCLDVLQQFL
jgi:hypothetical protein